jgi:hypothetical protein
MAQPIIRSFVADVLAAIDTPDPVVEFGALQVEAHQEGDLRPLFAGRPFTGSDMRPGPGVDRVDDLRALGLAEGEVGTALCLDTLEHCEDPPQACRELARVTADGGVCLVSSVMLLGIHGYPSDFFRFTPEGLRAMLAQGFDDVAVAGLGDPAMPIQVVGVGAKGRSLGGLDLTALPSLRAAQERYDAPGAVRIGPLRIPPREAVRTVVRELARAARAGR